MKFRSFVLGLWSLVSAAAFAATGMGVNNPVFGGNASGSLNAGGAVLTGITSQAEVAAALAAKTARSTAFEIYTLGDSQTEAGLYQAQLVSLLGSNWHTVNLGAGGNTVAQMLARATVQITSNGAGKFAIVWGGINDITGNRVAVDILADLQSICTLLHAAGFKVIVITIPPFGSNADWSAPREAVRVAVNTGISSLTGVDYVIAAHTLFAGVGNNLNVAYDSGDGLHINSAGHILLGTTIYNSVTWSPTGTAEPRLRLNLAGTDFYQLGPGKLATDANLFIANPHYGPTWYDQALTTMGGIGSGREVVARTNIRAGIDAFVGANLTVGAATSIGGNLTVSSYVHAGGDLSAVDQISVSGIKPLALNASTGTVDIHSIGGGWALGMRFRNAADSATLGYIAARGTGDTLDHYAFTDLSLAEWASFSPTATVFAGTLTAGSGSTAITNSTGNLLGGALAAGSVANAALANSSITIAGTSVSLGGSITLDAITGLSSTGLLKRTGANTFAIATSGTDYAPATSGSSILYANGSGGFSSVTIGSGLSFSTGTLSASGSGNVTHTGALTAGKLVSGNSSGDIKVTGIDVDGSDNLNTSGTVTASGNKPTRLNGTTGTVDILSTTGGWALGTRFRNAADSSTLGYFTARGTGDTLDHYALTDGSLAEWIAVSPTLVTLAGNLTTSGAFTLTTGGAAKYTTPAQYNSHWFTRAGDGDVAFYVGGTDNIGSGASAGTEYQNGWTLQIGGQLFWSVDTYVGRNGVDTGLKRRAAGVVQATDGSTGIGALASSTLALRDTSAAFDVTVGATSSSALTANRTLTIDMANASRTLKMTGNLTLDGSGTISVASGKTGTFSNTLTFTGNDSSSVAFGGGGTVLYNGGALGTPSSGTLTNASGLPITGLVASTSTALGVGSIELGHASDTSITRVSAGVIAVEGVNVLLSGGALGTPSSGTLTNVSGLPISGLVASTSTALGVGSIELGHASDTTIARSAAGTVTIEGNTILTSATDLTTQPIDNGGWSVVRVSGSNATTTNTTATTITGLTSGNLSTSTLYEFEAVLKVASSSSAGNKYAVTCAGSGTAATINATIQANTSSTAAVIESINAIDTLNSTAMVTSGADGIVVIRGFLTTRGSGTPTISIQQAKVTSGTATAYIGCLLRVRKA